MKQADRDILIRIDERVKCLPIIKKDIKRINGSLIKTKTRLDNHLQNKEAHSKFNDSKFNGNLAWPGKIVNFALKMFRVIK